MEDSANRNPKVEIDDFFVCDNRIIMGKKEWDVGTIFNAAKNLPIYNLQLSAIDINVCPWDVSSFDFFLYHSKRVYDADLSYPIIQMPTGYIIDGWHRVAKAILNGDSTIKCIRLKTMPEPDRIKNE